MVQAACNDDACINTVNYLGERALPRASKVFLVKMGKI